LALAAIKKGLRDWGPGTLRFSSLAKNFKTLQQFLVFKEGFMRGEEDAEEHLLYRDHPKGTCRDDNKSPSLPEY
jgi:hypothetical protein